MELILKVFGLAILLIGMILLTAFITTIFLYAGWNWGFVPAMGGRLQEIDLVTTFWLSMCLSAIGSFFKTSVTSQG